MSEYYHGRQILFTFSGFRKKQEEEINNMSRSSALKQIIIFILFLHGTFALVAQTRVDETRRKLFDKNGKDVLVVAHRGDWRYAPENSLAAIENAIKMGVDVVEIDIQKTKDGQLILMHDKTLDRTTTGKGAVSTWTLDSIRNLNLRNGAAIKTIHKVPTLEETLLLSKGKIMLNLDKAYDVFDEVYVLLEKTGTVDHIIMKGTATSQKVKEQFGKYLDKVIYMPIVNLDKPNAQKMIDDFIKELNPVAFELLYVKDANPLPKQLSKTLQGKSLIWYNTLWDTMAGGHDDDMSLKDPDKGYGYLINDLGARIIQTDRPQYLIDYLKSKNRHFY
ncbi:glycerophosphoryl diester phosphodiesterase [Pseudopedobacter saltans DSM 12145]|uniref:Glycerophosphoryl diester phosphodiesterase n=1 Tax=Pseudopedobacter saltans (strain ATCC 51119 / DSM 12145 / JCM 21818 / CCUG 39354 / LMG 10337 / NBRC 100064 / NCIMB 13643) TaxID=762903 RepID=F0S5C8_PSESL|nr:glycerophosphodiester phosphodiesterase family protein [Pseudopedobacter saltans]ADY52073.1 glycerophosphoryl diester phosphodiesterase [Pseudopedobacter saltans DSM 12145]